MDKDGLIKCSMCAMDIPSAAKKCPYCQHYKGVNKIFKNPIFQFLAAIIGSLLVLYVVFKGFFGAINHPDESFTQHKNDLIISVKDIKFGEDKCGQTVVILGELKNIGQVKWDNILFDIQFKDSIGNITDSKQDKQYVLLINANDSINFKISFKKDFPDNYYSKYDIKIIDAKDANKPF